MTIINPNLRTERRASFPNLNYKEMRKVCSAKPVMLAKKYGLKEYNTPGGKAWFKDNGANILAIAHLDSRVPFLHFEVARLRPDSLIYCPTLDDRLGAYIILDWLQTANIKADILLTENEEKGASTAAWFQFPKGKKYNWMFMFDRAGSDVVMYNYRDTITAAMLEKHGWKVGNGSYSCICDLEDLGVKGFNFGAGYHDYHTEYAWASRNELMINLRKFVSFHNEYVNVELPHVSQTSYLSRYQGHLPFTEYKIEEEANYDSLYDSYGRMKTTEKIKIQGSEDKKVDDSRLDQLREKFKQKQLEKEKEKSKEILSNQAQELLESRKRAIAVLLTQDINTFGFDADVIDNLYSNRICLLIELAIMSRIELLKLPGITKKHVDNIELILKRFDLGFSTRPMEYNVRIQITRDNVNHEIRKEITNLNTMKVISTSEPIVEESKVKEAGITMIPLQLPLISEVKTSTEKEVEIDRNDAEIIMIGIERHQDNTYKLVSDKGKLVWRASVKQVGFTPVPSS